MQYDDAGPVRRARRQVEAEGQLDQIDRLLPVGWAWGDRYDDTQAATVERYS